jgi:hypothetical protein
MINVDKLRVANNKQMSRCRKENGEKQRKRKFIRDGPVL